MMENLVLCCKKMVKKTLIKWKENSNKKQHCNSSTAYTMWGIEASLGSLE